MSANLRKRQRTPHGQYTLGACFSTNPFQARDVSMTDLFEYFRTDLKQRAQRLSDRYRNANPFPHIVIDDFLPLDVAERILDLFPSSSDPHFKQPDYKTHQAKKLGRVQDSYFVGIDPWLRSTLFEFNSMAFLDFLEILTGINGLIPDPHFKGGAFHQILPGGKLDVHADFNTDERRMLLRRINALIYLNKDWKPDYHGELELWTEDMRSRIASIPPIFNRCVIFNTTSTAFHGHPTPLASPPGITRKSIALYYYSSDVSVFRAESRHRTLWQEPLETRAKL